MTDDRDKIIDIARLFLELLVPTLRSVFLQKNASKMLKKKGT